VGKKTRNPAIATVDNAERLVYQREVQLLLLQTGRQTAAIQLLFIYS
jgi:hypothetical protein